MNINWKKLLGSCHPSYLPEKIAQTYGVPKENNGHNDSTDAFRHAYASAVATYLMGENAAKAIGDWNEDRLIDNPPKERNMDLWNNNVGREIGESAQTLEEIGRLVYEAYQSGDLITNLDDTRIWVEPGPSQSDLLPEIMTRPGGRLIFALFIPMPGIFSAQIVAESLIELYKTFTTAETVATTPIVLDLDGDGVETTHVADGAYFDHDANGFAEQTGWASSGEEF